MSTSLQTLFFFFIISFGIISAQETATKVSNFEYGLKGENYITSVNVVDGKLYANFHEVYGDDAASLISTLDPVSGTATGLLDPERTHWSGGALSATQPVVFSAGDMLLGIQRDQASGNSLYRLDGASVELLHSSGDVSYAKPVAYGDSIYFLTASSPFTPYFGRLGSGYTKLWRSDGTAAGTNLVASLPSPQGVGYFGMVVGENKLLINIIQGGRQVFYRYAPETGHLDTLFNGGAQFSPITRTDRRIEQPMAYYDGGFYINSIGGNFGGRITSLYRIGEVDFDLQEIDLPVMPNGHTAHDEYDQLEFLNFKDSLYLFLGQSQGENGNDLYRVGGPNGLTITPIRANLEFNETYKEDHFNPAIVADTLYYLARRGTDSVTLFAYNQTMDAPQPLINVSIPGTTAFLAADERYVYVTNIYQKVLIRFDKKTGQLVAVAINYNYYNSYNYLRRINPVAILPEGAYMVGTGSPGGLFHLPAGKDSLISLGDYVNPINRINPLKPIKPFIAGKNETTEELVIWAGSYQSYQADSDNYLPVTFPGDLDIASTTFLTTADGISYSSVMDSLYRSRIIRVEAGTAIVVPYTSHPYFDPLDYYFSSTTRINAKYHLIQFVRPAWEDTQLSLVEFSEDSVRLINYLPEEFAYLDWQFYSDSTYIAFTRFRGNNNFGEVTILNYDGVEQFRTSIHRRAKIRGITPEGVFIESFDPESYVPELKFHPFSGDEAVTLDYSGSNAHKNENFYLVNGRLLFPGTTPEQGQELLVADPETGRVDVVKDINPGQSLGILADAVRLVTKSGLFFCANDGVHGNELWYTDGTQEGTVMLPEINPGPNSANPTDFVLIGDIVFFAANGPSGYEVYRMWLRDKKPELIIEVNSGTGDAHPYGFSQVGEDFYFLGREAAGTTFELYRIAYELVPTNVEPTQLAAKIFPNPVRDQPLTITAPEGENLERMQLFNQQGQLLREVNSRGSSARFDLSDLPAGTYWLRSWYDSGRFSINAVQHVR